MMGYMCVQSFITQGISFTKLAHFIGPYHNVLPGANFCCLHVNRIVNDEKNALARPVMDSDLWATFHLHILIGFSVLPSF